MNIPIHLKCSDCGASVAQRIHLSASALDFKCTKCGCQAQGIFGLDATVGALTLVRSQYELLVEKDYDMAIVLSAAALDCELSWLFCKWKGIEAPKVNSTFSPEDCEKQLQKLGNIVNKITSVSEMLCKGGIEAYVASSTEWSATIKNGFPSLHIGSLAKNVQQKVFRPRNRVLHQGYAEHTESDASKCYSIAELGIRILKDMDKAKLRWEEKDAQTHE